MFKSSAAQRNSNRVDATTDFDFFFSQPQPSQQVAVSGCPPAAASSGAKHRVPLSSVNVNSSKDGLNNRMSTGIGLPSERSTRRTTANQSQRPAPSGSEVYYPSNSMSESLLQYVASSGVIFRTTGQPTSVPFNQQDSQPHGGGQCSRPHHHHDGASTAVSNFQTNTQPVLSQQRLPVGQNPTGIAPHIAMKSKQAIRNHPSRLTNTNCNMTQQPAARPRTVVRLLQPHVVLKDMLHLFSGCREDVHRIRSSFFSQCYSSPSQPNGSKLLRSSTTPLLDRASPLFPALQQGPRHTDTAQHHAMFQSIFAGILRLHDLAQQSDIAYQTFNLHVQNFSRSSKEFMKRNHVLIEKWAGKGKPFRHVDYGQHRRTSRSSSRRSVEKRSRDGSRAGSAADYGSFITRAGRGEQEIGTQQTRAGSAISSAFGELDLRL